MRELLAHGADVNIKGISNLSVLMVASAYHGHLAIVRMLCDVPGVMLLFAATTRV